MVTRYRSGLTNVGSLFSSHGNGSPFVAIGLKGSVSLSSSGTIPDDSLPEQGQSEGKHNFLVYLIYEYGRLVSNERLDRL